jgi:hypothetical protein
LRGRSWQAYHGQIKPSVRAKNMIKIRIIIALLVLSAAASTSTDSLFSNVTGINLNLNDKMKNVKKLFKIYIFNKPYAQKLEYIQINDSLSTQIFFSKEDNIIKRIESETKGNKKIINTYYKKCKSKFIELTGSDSSLFENNKTIFIITNRDTTINITTYCKDSKYNKAMQELLKAIK